MRLKYVFCVLASIVTLTLATPIMSIVLLLLVPREQKIPLAQAAWAWWPYGWQWITNPDFRASGTLSDALAKTGGPALVILLSVNALMLMRSNRRRVRPARADEDTGDPERAASSARGRAAWMSTAAARALFPGPIKPWGGVVIGEAYSPSTDPTGGPYFDENDPATWGRGGKADLLIDPCVAGATHGVVVAGSGGYKTESTTKPAMLHWTGSCVVNDPSGQFDETMVAIRRAMGHRVAVIDPERPELGAFNAFCTINPDSKLFDVQVADWVARNDSDPTQGKKGSQDQMFPDQGNNLLICLLSDLLTDPSVPAEQKTPREWRARIVMGEKEVQSRLHDVAAESHSKKAREIAATLRKVVDRTWSGIYSHAVTSTSWLSTEALADLVSGDTFDPTDLAKGRNGRLDVILQIPMGLQQSTPAVGRVILGALLETVYQAWRSIKSRVLFILDECWMFGKMDILRIARNAGRKHMITLLTIWPSLGDIDAIWSEAERNSWMTSASWVMFSAVSDDKTAELISKRCGSFTTIVRSEGSSRSSQGWAVSVGALTRGTNQSVSEGERRLIEPEAVTSRIRTDCAIVFPRGRLPLMCGRAIAFRRPEMQARLGSDVYARRTNLAA